MFGIPKGQVSPLYKGCRGISKITVNKGYIKSRVFLPFIFFVGDRANTSSVRRSGGKELLSTIRQPFYPGRQTPWESRSTNGEDEFVLRKL